MTKLHEGPGFRLRHLRQSDEGALLSVTGAPAVMRHVGDGQVLTADQVRVWIDRSLTNYARYGYGSFALADPGDDRLFGWGGFIPPGRETVPEMIYGFEQARWGHGLGAKVAAALVDLGRSRFGFSRILATIDMDNTPSCRIVERLGFELSGTVEEEGVLVCRYMLHA